MPSRPGRLLAFLDHHSYALFLVHYPVCLACGALVFRLWPESPALNALGIVLAWLASLAAAVALQRAVDART